MLFFVIFFRTILAELSDVCFIIHNTGIASEQLPCMRYLLLLLCTFYTFAAVVKHCFFSCGNLYQAYHTTLILLFCITAYSESSCETIVNELVLAI